MLQKKQLKVGQIGRVPGLPAGVKLWSSHCLRIPAELKEAIQAQVTNYKNAKIAEYFYNIQLQQQEIKEAIK